MQDPFLADALDGYDKVKGNHQQRITGLRRQITQKSRTDNHRYLGYWSMAASILLLIGIGSYGLFYRPSLPGKNYVVEQTLPMNTEMDMQPETADTIVPAPPTPAKPVSPPLLADNKTTAHFTPPVIVKDEADIIKACEEAPLLEEQSLAKSIPKKSIHGKVVDKMGEPLIGASVVFAGTNQGTVTDLDGNFSLPGDTGEIDIRYIGYETINLPADTGRSMLIAMNESNQTLDEVVVIGYGTSKRANMTGSISTVSVKEIEEKFDDYVKRTLIHPTDEDCKDAKGNVKLRFSVDEKGRPYNITVEKPLCPSADQEAIRLVEHSPDWPLTEKEITKNIRF
jgi:outer membrane biosynthesis protein TonB